MSDYFRYSCSSCRNSIEVQTELMSGNCRCPYCNLVETPAPARNLGTQESAQTVGKTFLMFFGFIFLFFGIISGILPAIGGAIIVVAIIVIPAYLICTAGTDFFYRNNTQYQDYRKNGGQPFWDNFMRSETYIALPNQEPDYNEFVPPGHWKYQCLNCYARVQEPHGSCWNCKSQFETSNRAETWFD